jgi:hypothetical protein
MEKTRHKDELVEHEIASLGFALLAMTSNSANYRVGYRVFTDESWVAFRYSMNIKRKQWFSQAQIVLEEEEYAMSTASLSYPDVIRVRRVPAIGRSLILSSLVLIAFAILVMVISAANADLTNRAAISQNSIAPIAVPVPTPPITEIQPVPSETPTPSSGLAGGPSVQPVPVPTPPSQ